MALIDRRKSGKNKSVVNRQKFLKRYKNKIKRDVEELASSGGITDALKNRKVRVSDTDEPEFNFDMTTGKRDRVLPGNKNMEKGDRVHNDSKGKGRGSGGSKDGKGFDEFTFTLTKEEFLDIYFSDMELPDFIKENLKGSTKHKWKRSGYTKEGIPPRLDLVKTLKQAMARRIATGSKRYLDDVDLRYKHFTKQPFPIRKATMILLMDVSWSMGEIEKMLARKFFLLLYLFLHKVYDSVDLIFISHTQEAKEVTEEEFFYGQETGGTIVSSGLKLANDIIDDRIDLNTTNVYMSQASDGDNWSGDDDLSKDLICQLLQKVQYFAYIQTEQPHRLQMKKDYGVEDLYDIYKEIADTHKNLQARHVTDTDEVYPVLRSLFERK